MMRILHRFLRCKSGGIAIMAAVLMPIMIGFAGLGVEVGHWYLTGRAMQGAADSAAVSAVAEYVAAGLTGTSYQTVGKTYAELNGFKDGTSNVTVTICGPSDARAICGTSATQIKAVIHQIQTPILMPVSFGNINIAEPNVGASAVVTWSSTTVTSSGGGCVLGLANDPLAVLIRGNGNLQANCGLFVDGGRDQNVTVPPLGSLTFSGGNTSVHVSSLRVAASTAPCPGPKCFQFTPSTTLLPASAVSLNAATQATTIAFPTVPLGAQSVTVSAPGSAYTKNSTRTFTVQGGTSTFPAKFTATIDNTGKVSAIVAVIDPGAYTVMPTNPVSATADDGKGTNAKFNLVEGCFAWPSGGTPLPGRKYCSINLNGKATTNFAGGTYYIAGGDSNCIGFCVSSANATVTSDTAGVTLYLTHGAGTFASTYARVTIGSGSVSLCAPGTGCGTTCTGSCLLFVQDPSATATTAIDTSGNPTPSNTVNTFAGNGSRTLAGLLYFKNQTVSLQGNGGIQGCAGVIAKYIDVAGTPQFSNGCLPNGGFGSTTTTTTTYRLTQ
jgi:hypothetical protein